MMRFLRSIIPLILVTGGLTLAGCATSNQASPGNESVSSANAPTTQPWPNSNVGQNYANTDNSDIGNGSFGEAP